VWLWEGELAEQYGRQFGSIIKSITHLSFDPAVLGIYPTGTFTPTGTDTFT